MTFSSKTLIQGLAFSACALQGAESVALRALDAGHEAFRCAEENTIKGDVHRAASKSHVQDDLLLAKIKEMLVLTDVEASELQTLKLKGLNPNHEIGILQWVREITLENVLLDGCKKFQGYSQDESHLAVALIYSREESKLISPKSLDDAFKIQSFHMAQLQRSRDETQVFINEFLNNEGNDKLIDKLFSPSNLNPDSDFEAAAAAARSRIEKLKDRILDLYTRFVFEDVKTSWLNRNEDLSIFFERIPYDNAIKVLSGAAEADAKFREARARGMQCEVSKEHRNSHNTLVDLYANKIGHSSRGNRSLLNKPVIEIAEAYSTYTGGMIRFLLQRPVDDNANSTVEINSLDITVNRFGTFSSVFKLVSILSTIDLRLASATPTQSSTPSTSVNDASLLTRRFSSSNNSPPSKCLADLILSDGVKIILPMHIALLQMVRDYNEHWSTVIMRKNKFYKNNATYSWLKGYALALSSQKKDVEEIINKMVAEQYLGDTGKFMDHFIKNVNVLMLDSDVNQVNNDIVRRAAEIYTEEFVQQRQRA